MRYQEVVLAAVILLTASVIASHIPRVDLSAALGEYELNSQGQGPTSSEGRDRSPMVSVLDEFRRLESPAALIAAPFRPTSGSVAFVAQTQTASELE